MEELLRIELELHARCLDSRLQALIIMDSSGVLSLPIVPSEDHPWHEALIGIVRGTYHELARQISNTMQETVRSTVYPCDS